MTAEFQLENNNLVIIFKKDINSLIKIHLSTVHKLKKRDKADFTYEKQFLLKEAVEIKEFLEQNNYRIISSKKINSLFNEYYENLKKIKDKISELKKINKSYNQSEFSEFIKSLSFLKRPLLKHQHKPAFHLYKAKSAANFSVPGSGKTSVVLSNFQKLKQENKVDGIFVIGPKVCFDSWNVEFLDTIGRDPNIRKLSDSPKKRKEFYESHLDSELVTCHFSLVSKDLDNLREFFKTNRFILVIDEAHNIKKISGTWASSILALSKHSEFKVILTGTPMPNEFRDFFNYLDFLYGDNQILTAVDKAQIEVFIKNKKNDEAISFLNDKIEPFFTRVTKSELNLSKPIFNKPTYIKMNPIEEKIYYSIVTRIKNFDEKNYLSNIELVEKLRKAKIIRLMQTCSYIKNLNISLSETDLIDGVDFSDIEEEDDSIGNDLNDLITNYDTYEKPGKLIELQKMIKNFVKDKKKVLIWSNHLKTIDLIKNTLSNDGHFVKVLIGATSEDERKKIKEDFNNKNSLLNIIVANPKACSESISLHKACQNAIYYDQNYNAAEFLQSLDRIHRVGGSENKTVYYDFLQYEDSIDKKIYKRVREKADKQMKVIESDNLIFSPEEIDDWNDFYGDITNEL